MTQEVQANPNHRQCMSLPSGHPLLKPDNYSQAQKPLGQEAMAISLERKNWIFPDTHLREENQLESR